MPSRVEPVFDRPALGARQKLIAEKIPDADHVMASVVIDRAAMTGDNKTTAFGVSVRQWSGRDWIKCGGATFAGGVVRNRRKNTMPYSTFTFPLRFRGGSIEITVETAIQIPCKVELDLLTEKDIDVTVTGVDLMRRL